MGFDSWHNVSYAWAPISDAYKKRFDNDMDAGQVIAGDRPKEDKFEGDNWDYWRQGSQAHRQEGANFLTFGGSVGWETDSRFGNGGDDVYQPRGSQPGIWWGVGPSKNRNWWGNKNGRPPTEE